ncbi:MAG: DEAD/DEAH box helicase [Desulfoprunum sp.]|nr:DEAD/DEAH box helicase [Desulfoprunum sp.]
MYNSEIETIPGTLPVLETVQLQPWFTSAVLNEGLRLIRRKKVNEFLFVRNAAGALIESEAVVALQFERSTKLHQGFIIRNRHCGLCRLRIDDKGCAHTAALAILSLNPASGAAKAMPMPLAFEESGWLKIGVFLYEWLSRTQYAVSRSPQDGFSVLEISPAEGLMQVGIPESFALQGELFFSHDQQKSGTEKPATGLSALNRQLQSWIRTPGERSLEDEGLSSKGWKKDTSFWIWLARMLYMLHGDILPGIHRDQASCRFELRINQGLGPGTLTLGLPRAKTWEIVRELYSPSKEVQILPAARECFRVFFNKDNNLEVEPSLRLADGRILARRDLVDNLFSSTYYLAGEGFLPIIRIPAEGTFRKSVTAAATLPLLGFLQNEAERDTSFTVAPNDIPAFLEANRDPLHFFDNIVDTDLLQLQIRECPDRLIIDSFEEQEGWCFLSCHYGLGNTNITLNDILAAREKRLTCLPGKEWLQIDGTPLSWLYKLAEDRLVTDGSGRIRLSHREVMALTAIIPDIEIAIEQKPLRKRLTDLLDVTCWTDDGSLEQVPDHLRLYQRHGLAWLSQLFKLGIGGLLADDMGLGKTHQGLALLQSVARGGEKTLMLVVCPASVVLNWAEKIDRFYPGMDYAVYYGPQRDLQKAQERGLILTTYGVVRQDQDLLQRYPFEIIVLDEIQHLKNRNTATHRAVAALNGRVKIGLTGTPVENSLQDLRSLFDICLPGFLGSEREFERMYVQPITEAGNTEVRERLGRLIHPFILRRNRKQVLTELPEIIEDDRICELSDDQIGLYREIIAGREIELESLENETDAIPYMNILATITRLKQICDHPCLVRGCSDPGEYASGKWDLFVELTAELLAADMKFVVFSQYVGMLDLIERYLQGAGIGFCSLKGNMPVGKRQKMIAEFNQNPSCSVFCASLLAGGVGIDLTGAQAVIHYDRWWNPAKEEQATARVHRMGQKNVVQVFRLITRGTLEEKIHHLISKKREIASSLIQEDEAGIIKQMDRRQLADLFRFSPVSPG